MRIRTQSDRYCVVSSFDRCYGCSSLHKSFRHVTLKDRAVGFRPSHCCHVTIFDFLHVPNLHLRKFFDHLTYDQWVRFAGVLHACPPREAMLSGAMFGRTHIAKSTSAFRHLYKGSDTKACTPAVDPDAASSQTIITSPI